MTGKVAIPSRVEAMEAHRSVGGGVAAVFPIHYPRALLRAFNLLPVEVWGPPLRDPESAGDRLQSYTCCIVRSGLSFVLDGGLQGVDAIVVPHACDSLQGLASVLMDFARPLTPTLPFYIPRGAREADLVFLEKELRRLAGELVVATGRSPSPEDLMRAIRREEFADQALARLHRSRWGRDDAERYRLIRAREYLSAETFVDLVRDIPESTNGDGRGGVPLILSGILPEPGGVFEAVAAAGARVVADDFAACGRRLYPVGRSADPYRRMAERLLGGPPDPTRGSPIAARTRHLLRLAEERGARGVVFYTIKFCEPELFDLPSLCAALNAEGLPTSTIEVDISAPLTRQVATRLEAFVEMLS